MNFRVNRAILLLFLIATSALRTYAQVTREDYERAEKFLPAKVKKLMHMTSVNPHWILGTDRFWFLKEAQDAKEFILVDPLKGTVTPAFNHEKLATALSTEREKSYEKEKLPINSIDFINDGKSICFELAGRIWTCDLQSYELKSRKKPKSSPVSELVSPDKKWAAYTRDHNLFIKSLTSGTETQLTTDGVKHHDYASFPESNQMAVRIERTKMQLPPLAIWSPDSKKLITYQLDQRKVEELHIVQHVTAGPGKVNRSKHFSYRMPLPGDANVPLAKLIIFDVEQGKKIPVQTEPAQIFISGPIEFKHLWWGKKGKKLYYVREGRGFKKLNFYEIDANTGTARIILEETGKTFLETNADMYAFSPNIRVLYNGAEIIWFSERDGWGHLYLYDGKTGQLKKQITKGEWLVRNIIRVDEDQRQVYFTAGGREKGRDPYYRHLYRINLDGSGMKLLSPEDADHNFISLSLGDGLGMQRVSHFSPSGRFFVDNHSRIDMAPATVIRDWEGNLILRLQEADFSELLSTGWSWPEPFKVKARDGATDIYGIIIRPTHFSPYKKYPVLDDIYPGPQTIRTPKSFPADALSVGWFWRAQAIAELGFIVINIDGMGTPLRSKAFHDVCFQNLGDGGGIDDHVTGIYQLAQKYPYMDIMRVGVYGHSSGGYGSMRAILKRPDFYDVCVSSAGYMDPRSVVAYWSEKYQGYPVGANYNGNDNMSLVKNLKGKLLIAIGDLDENVDPSYTYPIFDALIKANKDFDLLVLPNRDHGFTPDPYFMRRKWDYFVRHLYNQEPPKEYKIGDQKK